MANIALIIWPLVAFFLFARLPFRPALIWSVLLAYLFLPERIGFNFPMIPALDKASIPAVTLVVAALVFAGSGSTGRPGRTDLAETGGGGSKILFRLLMAGLVLSPFLTVFSNPDTTVNGGRVLPGLRPWDALSMVAEKAALVVPFFLARRHLATPEAHGMLLRALLVAGLAYSALALVEVRLSPQLNQWIYGYYQHSFAQHIRGGHFRPMLFLDHGLSVGFFFFTVVIASAGLYRFARSDGRNDAARRLFLAGLWLAGILMVSRNLGATSLAVLLSPLVLLLGTRWQVRIAAVVAIVFTLYPAVRQAGLAPTDKVTQLTAMVAPSRVASFQFRLDNEDILLDRAQERPLAGWGSWSRNRVFDEEGRDVSVTDGVWIIVLGTTGWVGYIAFFGLLALPVILLLRVARKRPIPIETAALSVIMAGNFLYMIPNSTLSPVAWLMAGALAGFLQFDRAPADAAETAEAPPDRGRRLRHTRFGDRSGPGTGAIPTRSRST